MGTRKLYLVRHGEADAQGALTARGEEQARLLGERLEGVGINLVHHSPVARAVRTARIVVGALGDGVEMRQAEDLADHVPPVADPAKVPPLFRDFLEGVTPSERARGAELAASVTARLTAPTDVGDSRELVVTHNFQVAWFVRLALDAPDWRWLTLNQGNTGLSVVMIRSDRPPSLLVHNDLSHLPPELRWTGFPDELRV